MPPDAESPVSTRAPEQPQSAASDEPHPGCNCGRRRASSPPAKLLTPDLVIAARDRAREPELPATTESRALATPITPRLARYDLIIVCDGAVEEVRAIRLAAEFARHEHRVFVFGNVDERRQGPAARTASFLPLPETGAALLNALSDLRQREGIETPVLIASSKVDLDVVQQIKERWGWRVAVASDAPPELRELASVRIAFGAADELGASDGMVPLPATLSWPARWAALDRAFRDAWPKASLVVVTHDNLAFSRMCIESIFENTDYPNYELLLIDNDSSDGSVEEFTRLARDVRNVRFFRNEVNAGFGPACNQGFREANGALLVILNNDIIVPRGWLTRLAHHLDDPAVGLIGPATNRTCNEAQIELPYQTYGEYLAVARAQAVQHDGERIPIRMPMFFCVAFRRDTFERIGPLDERYEVGMFEDEDYAIRAKAAGYQVAWTPEVYVHHAYHASIGKLLPTGEYIRLVKLNQGRFEEKWGICWERHRPVPVTAS
jgi:GT2 family glycosyltransferase